MVHKERQKVTRKERVDFHINNKTIQDCGKPVDYSFRNIRSFDTNRDLIKIRFARIREIPQKISTQFLSRSVWLASNNIRSISGMDAFLENVIFNCYNIGWLDLSFNKLKTIDDVIFKFPNLAILYLHGNLIEDFLEVGKLRALKHLRSVTLTGNPISKLSHYRRTIIALLPHVANIDHVSILKSERTSPKPVEFAKIKLAQKLRTR